MLKVLQRVIDSITTIFGVLAGVALLYLILGTTLDALQRRFIGQGIPGVFEYAEVVLVVLVYLSLAQTQRHDGHVSVDIVALRLPVRVRATVEAIGLALVALVLMFITWQAGDIAWNSYQRGEYRLGLTRALIWPARATIVFGLAVLIMQILLRMKTLMDLARGRKATELAEQRGSVDLEKYL